MDYKKYSEELEKIIGAITLPDDRRIIVDAFVEQARMKAEGWTEMQPNKPAYKGGLTMNYYIQGDAAKADQIKAAFEVNGIDTSANSNYGISNLFYFSCNGEVAVTQNRSIINIIKTHPDYKELELPVEPKFKKWDRIRWINHDVETQTITDIRDGSYITVDKYGIRCALKFAKQDEWELVPQTPHYDIANFKPFDKVLVRDDDNECWMPSLFGWFDSGLQDGKFVCETSDWHQCIPYEGNEHLLGTTDMCDEQYINW